MVDNSPELLHSTSSRSEAEDIHRLKLELDFLSNVRRQEEELLYMVARGARQDSMLSFLVEKFKQFFPRVRPCLLWCDKDLAHWRIENHKEWSNSVCNTIGEVISVPQALLTFAASPSRPFVRIDNLSSQSDWIDWHQFLSNEGISGCWMHSVQDHDGNWLTVALFFDHETLSENITEFMVEQSLKGMGKWIKAGFERKNADRKLLISEHYDEQTGLLRDAMFDTSLELILKDARRNFQRLAVLCVKLHGPVLSENLKTLSTVLQETLRDNDLISRYSDNVFLTGVRIGHLDDAEIIANKIYKALSSEAFRKDSSFRGNVGIGVAFYPEQSTLDALYIAAHAAADQVDQPVGYRIEYHGRFLKTMDDAYDL
ncbi:GGDEF domain-containing protein [Marinomonas mediterranea]|jgi:FOG: GGDEF domain|uniref:Diguanylate cyclase n=1 Tax=Marinomonas mediterranea (strain ATCC 700492 / JCM 21426 / NBRC 103028 / MMB-1) TaxID=717774 RepID=F2JW23_MARM1|nr:GGDEF domain-containing protein [Marinomonas mediterranea]ADZ92911.1 diguanylate cyclase [Marinomonas mediterranea MMB-1]WCN10833.1 diguanylate cyclase [Marinomonas mediterranea]WCN14890.1 diguanylate cyclase [Marinomonas mediterranea]WCN18934.1 diguanylate cyclase [Marinomonas mediterranea MMB-1]